MEFSTAILAYLGPETMLPVTSAVAGVMGVILLFGKNSLRWVIQIGRGLAAKVGPRRKSAPQGSRKIGTGPVGQVASRKAKRDTLA